MTHSLSGDKVNFLPFRRPVYGYYGGNLANTPMNTLSKSLRIAATLTMAGVLSLQLASPSSAELRSSPKEIVDEVWQVVNREFVDGNFNDTDWLARRDELLARDYATEEDAYAEIRIALSGLGDPFTRFLDPDDFSQMQIETAGELSGVGMQLGTVEETEELVVVAPTEGGPAAEAGITTGDILTAIDGESTADMDISQAVNLIRGEVGTEVTLTMKRDTETLDFTVTREVIALPVVTHDIRQENGQSIGYIRLSQFSSHAAEEMQAALEELEAANIDGYVLDLRSNPGGLLFASTEIARMFMNDGAIVSVDDRNGERDVIEATGSALSDKPLAVLVNGASASASEILAGALQDSDRAVLVGSQTFGKGSVQSVHNLSGGTGLAVTIARYRTPSGRDINQLGIAPDIEVELSTSDVLQLNLDPNNIGTQADPQYAAAIGALGL
ncbi:MAG: S41 family peptidase [Synechococcus sp.]